VIERHGIEWEQKGTHKKHLSVLNYEKEMRTEEVSQLETQIEDLQDNVEKKQKSADKIQARLDKLQERENLINLNVRRYDDGPEWQLPEPGMLMTANSYKAKIVEPFIKKLKGVVRSIVTQYLSLKATVNDLKNRLSRAYADNEKLTDRIDKIEQENTRLIETVKDYRRVRKVLGEEQTDSILARARAEEQALKRPVRSRGYER
jgi:chromosome segregation ATPase